MTSAQQKVLPGACIGRKQQVKRVQGCDRRPGCRGVIWRHEASLTDIAGA